MIYANTPNGKGYLVKLTDSGMGYVVYPISSNIKPQWYHINQIYDIVCGGKYRTQDIVEYISQALYKTGHINTYIYLVESDMRKYVEKLGLIKHDSGNYYQVTNAGLQFAKKMGV